MQIISKKSHSLLKATLLLIFFSFALVNVVFATSYEEPNVVIGKNSSEADEVYIDTTNRTLEKLKEVLSVKDYYLALAYVSDYRKGNRDAEKDLQALIAKYDDQNFVMITKYILNEKMTKYLTSFTINHYSNTLTRSSIKILDMFKDKEIDQVINTFWKKVIAFIPEDFSSNVDMIYIESDKDEDNLITLCPLPGDNNWALNIDINLLQGINYDTLNEYLMYATVFYYVLNDSQVEKLVVKKDNYVYNDKTYRDDSFINKFYKRFWKNRREEVNDNQYKLYKKEFLNEKASRTVYDDMAVSFVNYVRNGYMRRYLGFRADKTNFFDDYELFKDLAKHFRGLLGINKM